MKLRARRRSQARDVDAPAAPAQTRFYEGRRHGHVRLCECWWLPDEDVCAGAFLDRWISAAERVELAAAGFGVGLTLVDLAGEWLPLTVATRSELVPGEYYTMHCIPSHTSDSGLRPHKRPARMHRIPSRSSLRYRMRLGFPEG